MTAISKAWVTIADAAVDPDSPLDATLMTGLRDDLIHLREWLGAGFTAGAVQDHDHDGVNSKLIPIGPNYIRNPGFESDLGGWTQTQYTGGTIARVTSAGNFSQGVASCGISSTSTANGGGDLLLSEFKPVNGGHSYPVRADVKASVANISAKIEVHWYDSVQALISTSTVWTSTNTETSFVTKQNAPLAPSTARFAKARLTGGIPGSGSSTGTIYFDNVFMGEAQPVAPGTVAFGASVVGVNSPAATTQVKTKEIVCPFDGVITTVFTTSLGGGATARIYINGVAAGTNRTTAGTFTEDITVKRGDLVQVYAGGDGGTPNQISNLQLQSSVALLAPTTVGGG